MDPQQLIAKGRALIIAELNIDHLSEAEQNAIVDGLSEVIFRRVLQKLFQLVPENERDTLQKLLKQEKGIEAQALVQKYVQNVDEVIHAEVRAGVDEHKRLVAEEAAETATR